MRRVAALAACALALTACGGSTGVQDAGKPPVLPGPAHTVRLWFIRPGGRAGVESDLTPVTTTVRAFPDDLERAVFHRLLLGPGNRLVTAGYRSLIGCCQPSLDQTRGSVNVPGLPMLFSSQSGFHTPADASRTALAGAAQIQRTLAELPGVRSVTVQGLTRSAVDSRLSSDIDTSPGAPRRRGSCATARRLAAASVTVTTTTPTAAIVHVRAPQPLAIEIDLADEGEQGSGVALATAVPCGTFDLAFPGPSLRVARANILFAYVVRATPLTGHPAQGVTKRFTSFATPVPW